MTGLETVGLWILGGVIAIIVWCVIVLIIGEILGSKVG